MIWTTVRIAVDLSPVSDGLVTHANVGIYATQMQFLFMLSVVICSKTKAPAQLANFSFQCAFSVFKIMEQILLSQD